MLQVPVAQGQSNPIIDYITPIWPSIACTNPTRYAPDRLLQPRAPTPGVAPK
jgi:hypothetical protein